MQLSIKNRGGKLTDETHEFAERRFRFALSRFAPKIERVSAIIADVNGPRGGRDKSCRVTMKLNRLGTLTVTCDGADLESTFAQAADRAGRAVARVIQRNQRIDRRTLRGNWQT